MVSNDAIPNAIRLINEHREVEYVGINPPANPAGFVAISIAVRPSLPRQWCALGESPNGIRVREPVTMLCPPTFPLTAPTILLRQDFPRHFPHMYPRRTDQPPVPCLFDGNLSDLMHREGFASILNQLVRWLEKAAMDELIDHDQGWEPTRRDTLRDFIVADAEHLRSVVCHRPNCAIFEFRYQCETNLNQTHRWYGYVTQERIRIQPSTAASLFLPCTVADQPEFRFGKSIAILSWPPDRAFGKAVVADRYSPDPVCSIATLRERADEFDCAKYLFQRLDWLKRCMAGHRLTYTVPIVIVLCARRPTHLINSTSTLELCHYVVELAPATGFAVNESALVRPAAHCDRIGAPMLMSLSGESSADRVPWVQVGAGSLGSKIALHLTRAGRAPSVVVDSGCLRPHNAARHALAPTAGSSPLWGQSKALALAGTIRALGQDARGFPDDIVDVVHDSERTAQLMPKGHWAIVNSTASLPVREALSALADDVGDPQVIETSLYAHGTIGLLTVEGPHRNPSTGDLFVEAHRSMLENPAYRSLTVEGADPMQRHMMVGEGCGSLTTPMSDAQISMLGAPMARILADLQRSGLPNDAGRIYLGSVAADGYSVSWKVLDVRPWTTVAVDAEPRWKVRLSADVDSRIRSDSGSSASVEAGGVLIGRFSEASQTFHVCDLLPAPADSLRTPTKFTLGTKGLTRRIEEFQSTDLFCLGTWHSHLTESGPSLQDRKTAGRIGRSRLIPSVLLIRTPTSYRAVLARPSPRRA